MKARIAELLRSFEDGFTCQADADGEHRCVRDSLDEEQLEALSGGLDAEGMTSTPGESVASDEEVQSAVVGIVLTKRNLLSPALEKMRLRTLPVKEAVPKVIALVEGFKPMDLKAMEYAVKSMNPQ